MKVVDEGADLNAYASVDGQGACCSPAAGDAGAGDGGTGGLAVLDAGCCSPAEQTATADPTLHARLAKLLSEHDINHYAASVKVYAVKP